MSRHWTPSRLAILMAVLALAEWLRASGLGFGLPAVYNPDEVAIMSRALGFAKGDLNPHNFLYPTFYFYVLFAWVGGWFTVQLAARDRCPRSPPSRRSSSSIPRASTSPAARSASSAAWRRSGSRGCSASRLAGWRAGACAALFLAVAPTAVRDAHYVKHDVPVTLAIAAALVVLVRLARAREAAHTGGGASGAAGLRRSRRHLRRGVLDPLLRGLPRAAAGDRVAMRVGCRPARPAPGTGGRRQRGSGRVRLCGVRPRRATVVFFALSPFLLVEPRTAWQDIVANRQIVVDRAVDARQRPVPERRRLRRAALAGRARLAGAAAPRRPG